MCMLLSMGSSRNIWRCDNMFICLHIYIFICSSLAIYEEILCILSYGGMEKFREGEIDIFPLHYEGYFFLEIVEICLNEGCVLPLDHGKVIGRTPASFLSLAYLVGKSDCKRLPHLYHMVYITVFWEKSIESHWIITLYICIYKQ